MQFDQVIVVVIFKMPHRFSIMTVEHELTTFSLIGKAFVWVCVDAK